jgi:hypothetical protein
MSEFAFDLGSAVCRALEPLGVIIPRLCGDDTGMVVLGTSLLAFFGAVAFGLVTIERVTVSEFVRRAIAERTARRF